MGKLGRFAEETLRVTAGAAAWQDAPEVRLERVQADGYLLPWMTSG
ncbi:hypothetical protein [Sorangium sp. So ce362]